MTRKVDGVCHFFSETGTEGGYWAVQDKEFIETVDGRSSWSYEGLHILENGDQLTIYDPKTGEVLWEGVIDLVELSLFQEHVFGFWIHNDQKDMDREKWAKFFFEECHCVLEKRPSN